MVNPVITTCGHLFCHKCAFENLLFYKACSICRTPSTLCSLHATRSVAQTLKRFIEGLDPLSIELYQAREVEHNEWLVRRNVESVELEQKVDVLDTESIWCIGIVKQIHRFAGHKTIVKVHYQGWSEVYDEYICLNSPRLANLGFVTSRKGSLRRHAQIPRLL